MIAVNTIRQILNKVRLGFVILNYTNITNSTSTHTFYSITITFFYQQPAAQY